MSDIKKNFLDSAELLQGNSAKYLEQMHAKYSNNENDLDLKWQEFFMNFSDSANLKDTNNQNPSWSRKDWPPIDGEKYGFGEELQPQFESKIKSKLTQEGLDINAGELRRAVLDSVRALMLIRAYRIRGHLAAELDPLKVTENNDLPELDPRTYGFQLEDMDRQIYIDNVLGLELASMKEIIDIVHRTYCGTFALQYMHISNPDESQWLKERIEGYGKEINFTKRGRKAILNKLVEAEGFEKFLHVKYMGTKRFGLDGGEALIPAMEQIIKRGGALGVKDIIIGMPHRGRLNVLVNVLAKPL